MIIIVLFCAILARLTETSELSDRAAFLANKAFEQRLPTLVIWWHSDPNVVTEFLSKYHGLVNTVHVKATNANATEITDIVNLKQVVVFANNPEEYKYLLINLNQTTTHPIKILLVITMSIEKTDVLEIYTKISWDNDVTDILIISSDMKSDLTLSTYMPYGSTKCGNYAPVILKPDTSILYPRKFLNFFGCPIKVIVANVYPFVLSTNDSNSIRGTDNDLLNLVFEKLNTSMIKRLTNYSGNEIFHYIVNDTFDMVLPSLILNHKRFYSAQASHVFRTLDLVLCAPNRREIYAWAKVLLPFFTNTTPLIIASFLIFMGSVALIQRLGKYRKNAPRGIIFGTLGLFLGQEINFETKYWLNNGIFMLWIWYCTIVRIAYQGDLVDGLQKTILEPHLRTIDQAIKVVDEFGGPQGLLLQMSRSNSSLGKNLQVLPWNVVPHYIEDISKGRRFLLITHFSYIQHSPFKVQVVDERLSSIPQVYFGRARWGGAKEINRRMIQLFEAGLVSKIERDYHVKTIKDDYTAGHQPLAMTTVASCFLGLVVLYFLWAIVLCAEIVWHKHVEKTICKQA